MRSDIENLVNAVATEIWDHWSATNNALARRAAELLEAKSKLQMHLHKIQQEIFDIEKNIELLRKSMLDKSNYLKVAHTRLEARTHRKQVELCRDMAQDRYLISGHNTIFGQYNQREIMPIFNDFQACNGS